jgi:hypothetical protein
LPLLGCILVFFPRHRTGKKIKSIGLCVNRNVYPTGQSHIPDADMIAMVYELGVNDLLIRVPLSDIENIDDYVKFVRLFEGRAILINILQDRRHIEDQQLLKQSLNTIFEKLSSYTSTFQIGNSINRKKWGFVTTYEYFNFYKVAQKIRDESYPEIHLLGGNTIDFELPNFARSIFHASKIKYDGIAVQLYVDRRGAPENSQFGYDLIAKIKWFYGMIMLSHKTSNKLYITETNWPLIGTEPYAPAVGDCMVDEHKQLCYLLRYYLLMFSTGTVEKCYWHQLVAPGYGLIDNRGESVRKRKAFYALQTLYRLFNDAEVIRFSKHREGYFSLKVRNSDGVVQAIWSNGQIHNVKPGLDGTLIDATGKNIDWDAWDGVSDEPVFVTDY